MNFFLFQCQYKHIVDWCGCSPNDFTPEYWSKLESTRERQIFFARKFEPIVHHDIINRVEDWSKNVTSEESENKNSYWQNIYHHDDHRMEFDPTGLFVFFKDYVQTVTSDVYQYLHLQSLTAFSYKNSYNGTLAMMEIMKNGDDSERSHNELEIKFRYLPKQKMNPKYRDIVEVVGVGGSFDLKELIFRNYVNMLGQVDKLAARLLLLSSMTEELKDVVSIGWFDPNRNLVATNKLQFNQSSLIEPADPKLNVPLQPGVWTVIGSYNKEYLFSEHFLVVDNPLEIRDLGHNPPVDNKDLFYEQLAKEHRVFTDNYNELQQLDLIKTFFTIDAACSVKKLTGVDLPLCSDSSWSSEYPDPKSDILGVDPSSGQII